MNKPYIIGITGGSGSGKTTLIRAILKSFSKGQICFVSQDNYYRPREEQKKDEKGIHNFDLPESIDQEAFVRDIKKIISGSPVKRKEYVFNNKEAVQSDLEFKPAPVIVLEGIFIFHIKEIFDLIDLKVFVEAKDNLKLIRRIKRDQMERNYPVDDVLYRFQHHVNPTYEKYILPYKEHADIIINNNARFDEAVEMLKGYINYLLIKY